MTLRWKNLAAESAILAGALLLQQTLIRWTAFGPVRPDLTLIALVVVALRRGPIAGLYAGMAVGLVQDVYAVETLGANALAKCIVGYAAGFFEERVVKSMPATRVFLLGAAFVAHDVIFYLAAGMRGSAFWTALFRQTAPSAIYTLLVGAVGFYFFSRLKSRES